ncbi:uncharacterized protein BDZ99DRAFT_460304 [Mytilinidion resinicola]|uniref:Uncharacterized protein n=1 Tax=Mytilinidion resinicola TaxID=574789 RepID=A0A6A6YW31_9PEZI|nr:uncharacterized protein BDZ99DRAFT_460304 [Mytilinidion resinicola]KAF2812980.1 hypothetical protein BDZ99DRAFT_460304 [Mytilinidion resinicola]
MPDQFDTPGSGQLHNSNIPQGARGVGHQGGYNTQDDIFEDDDGDGVPQVLFTRSSSREKNCNNKRRKRISEILNTVIKNAYPDT